MDEFDDAELRSAGERWRNSVTVQPGVVRSAPTRRRAVPVLAVAMTIAVILTVSFVLVGVHGRSGRPPSGGSPLRAAVAPNGVLSSVSCTSASWCMTVGTYQPDDAHGPNTRVLAQSWDGVSWHLLPVPELDRSVTSVAVSCASPTQCVAVGTTYRGSATDRYTAFAYLWNGERWTSTTLPTLSSDSASLVSIDCVSDNLCLAAGYTSRAGGKGSEALVLRYSGSAWTVDRTPEVAAYPAVDSLGVSGGQLAAISCSSATFCAAVGFADSDTGTRHAWSLTLSNGRWEKLRGPFPPVLGGAQLTGVSCPADGTCFAVGQDAIAKLGVDGAAYAARLSDDTWHGVDIDGASPSTVLIGVSCGAPSACVAGGYASDGAHTISALVGGLTDAGLVVSQTAGLPAAGRVQAVSCPARDDCLAVGSSGTGTFRPTAARYHAGAWTQLEPLMTN